MPGGTGTGPLEITVNASGLASDYHNGSVTISADEAVNSSIVIPITLEVFDACNPAPTLTSISPRSAGEGSADTTIIITGTDIVPGSVVQMGSLFFGPLPTTYVSPTELQATIPSCRLSSPQLYSINVANPTPGRALSEAAPFSVVGPDSPAITSIEPGSANQGTSLAGSPLFLPF